MKTCFVFSEESISRAVEEETTRAGKLARDNEGQSLLDDAVMDEEQAILFRRLFLETRAETLLFLSPWMINAREGDFDANNFDDERDFSVVLDTTGRDMAMIVDAKVREFIVAYIAYRWMETRLPGSASVVLARAATARETAVRAMSKWRRPVKITGWGA